MRAWCSLRAAKPFVAMSDGMSLEEKEANANIDGDPPGGIIRLDELLVTLAHITCHGSRTVNPFLLSIRWIYGESVYVLAGI
jgi:hypothetical protein